MQRPDKICPNTIPNFVLENYVIVNKTKPT